MHVLGAGLFTMTPVTQCLPVAPVPEQFPVTTVRNDMINVRSLRVLTPLHALLAERMHLKELPAGLLPCTAVATADSGPDLLRVHRFVCVTVLGPGRNQCRAAGMLARHLGFHRHQRTKPHSANFSKPPRRWM